MERITLRMPKQQVEEVEQRVDAGEFPNRSEAIRSAVREMLDDRTHGREIVVADGGDRRPRSRL